MAELRPRRIEIVRRMFARMRHVGILAKSLDRDWRDFRLVSPRDLWDHWDLRREIAERFSLYNPLDTQLIEADVRRRGIPFALAFLNADCAELRYPRPGYGRAPNARHPVAHTMWDAQRTIWAYARWQIVRRLAEEAEDRDEHERDG